MNYLLRCVQTDTLHSWAKTDTLNNCAELYLSAPHLSPFHWARAVSPVCGDLCLWMTIVTMTGDNANVILEAGVRS